jgi:TIR domain
MLAALTPKPNPRCRIVTASPVARTGNDRLGNLISEADTVVFVLSPSSARSPICDWEVEEATRLNKRILPIVWRPLGGVSPPPRLRERNYIFFYEESKLPGSGFGTPREPSHCSQHRPRRKNL